MPSLPKNATRITDDEPNALEENELVRFIEVVRERWPSHYALILVLLTTAMRSSTCEPCVGRISPR